MLVTPGPGRSPTISEAATKPAHRVQSMPVPLCRSDGYCSVLQMHFGGITTVPLVTLDCSREPPATIPGRGQKQLPQFGRSGSEGDPLEASPVVAAREAANVAVTDDSRLEEARRPRRDTRSRPARAIGPGLVERIAQFAGHRARCQDRVEEQRPPEIGRASCRERA